MNATILAHRILTAIPSYKKFGDTNDWLLKLSNQYLGEPIGCYRNSEFSDDVIGIYTNGLVWFEGDNLIELRFSDISELVLANGKESEGLLLTVQDGRQLELPVKGQRGRFFDSMEMLRFLHRVIQNLRRQKQ